MQKLDLYSAFAAPELRQIVVGLGLADGSLVLDLGCGTGVITTMFADVVKSGMVVGLDLSLPHLEAARSREALPFVQADAERHCLRDDVFDLVWASNTINHLRDPVTVLGQVARSLRQGGRLVLAQSGFLPEMYFAWDSHLDDAVRHACHRYYRDRYGLGCDDTAGIRRLVGIMLAGGFYPIAVRTHVIERIQPLSRADREYFQLAIFDGSWRDDVRRLLHDQHRARLEDYCSPSSGNYCLDREDFHHIQTLTVCEGRLAA